ncbi:6-o-methylguanine dna methyltransferase [Moniliophthora roreri]|uniref:Methylated-DNA--protein-cysteine methyltransferase n=1 Tax=Moniliophthora roreri TaxID=221103 RepID=A0A0W0FQT7_MONRR|nr:6-o-methylguanine dna methyltransferase [Moniliophthora roreri]
MPAVRRTRMTITEVTLENLGNANTPDSNETLRTTDSKDEMYYPENAIERDTFKTKDGKRVPPHHWDVYDFTKTIPRGKVTTYKEVCQAVGGSPRSVGNALRNNPFAPYIPCHRVIASSLFAGGFCGEWGAKSKTGTQYFRKLDILKEEGLSFNEKGILQEPDKSLWAL